MCSSFQWKQRRYSIKNIPIGKEALNLPIQQSSPAPSAAVWPTCMCCVWHLCVALPGSEEGSSSTVSCLRELYRLSPFLSLSRSHTHSHSWHILTHIRRDTQIPSTPSLLFCPVLYRCGVPSVPLVDCSQGDIVLPAHTHTHTQTQRSYLTLFHIVMRNTPVSQSPALEKCVKSEADRSQAAVWYRFCTANSRSCSEGQQAWTPALNWATLHLWATLWV